MSMPARWSRSASIITKSAAKPPSLSCAFLRGEHPGQIPARVAKGTDIVVNLGVAEKLGVTLPASLVANASRVVE